MKVILSLLLTLAVAFATEVDEKWWKTMSLYQMLPQSFKDSDGDGIGDLKGIIDKLEHLVDAKVNAFWLSPIYPSPRIDLGYDISNFVDIKPIFGTLKDFDELLEKAHKFGLKVLMEFVPNHSSDKHEWFEKSIKNIPPYNDFYIWANGTVKEDGSIVPPNNWVSVFGGPAWTWNDERKAFYFHQFAPQQPDLNYYNENVIKEMKDVLRFWLKRGVDGFICDAIPHLFEDPSLKNEPVTGLTDNPNDYGYLDHIYTKDQPATYDMVQQWRGVVNEFNKENNDERILVIEAHTNTELTMKYYEYGAHFPFNFGMIERLNDRSSPSDFKTVIDEWMENMPDGAVANWVAGNHEKERMYLRYNPLRALAVMSIILLLPGVSVTYYADEIRLEDNYVSWEDTRDPRACNAGKEGYWPLSRDPARTPFPWDATTSAGFSTNKHTWLPINPDYKVLNLARQKSISDSPFKLYRAIAELRTWPAARRGDLNTYVLQENFFAFSRTLTGERSIYVVLSFSKKEEKVDLTEEIDNLPDQLVIYRTTLGSGLRYGATIDPKSAVIPSLDAVIYVTPENV